jgi:two-component system, OmpR family, sensor kinase
MSLTLRLSCFFVGALALVLVGFSVALYALATRYLERQVDERLTAALDTLEAAVDREPDGLDWDIQEKRVSLGKESSLEAVRWQVNTAVGERLDCSPNMGSADLGSTVFNDEGKALGGVVMSHLEGAPWRLAWRRVRSEHAVAKGQSIKEPRHGMLVLSAGLSLQPIRATLRQLGLALLGLSAGLLLTAAIVSRWVCRRAIAPVTRMAAVAREMGAPDLNRRLPDPGTRDQLSDFQRSFNGLLDRLQEAFERQRRFTGDASHQLRTPLTAMLGQVEVGLRRDRPPEDYRHVLAMVQEQANHLRRIVEALLFLARADAEAALACLESIDLATWLPDHLKAWTSGPRASDLKMELAGPAWARVHPILLVQLIDNLLDNALKYSEPGTPVRIAVKPEAGAVILAVEDRGQGIFPDDLPHIFGAFYRSTEARRQGKAGVGLGLAMAKRIAAAFGGTLSLESEIRQGCRITLRLPDGRCQ